LTLSYFKKTITQQKQYKLHTKPKDIFIDRLAKEQDSFVLKGTTSQTRPFNSQTSAQRTCSQQKHDDFK